MITKLQHIKRNVNPFGGILFCIDEIRKMGIPQLMDKHFGKRVKQAKYSHSDTILAWFYSTLCGSERLEDTTQLQTHFKEIPENKLPSPDTTSRIFKNLATENNCYQTKIAQHEFNINIKLNQLLINVAKKLNLINSKENYVMDYDNVVIPCEKYDSKWSYKNFDGYSPGVAFIGKHPIYIEGRNGNTPARYKIAQTVKRALDLCNESNIKIKTFRSDAAAYDKTLMNMLDVNGIEFFIRAHHSEKIFSAAINKNDWQQEVTSIEHDSYRYVVTRTFVSNNEDFKNKITNDKYVYRAIVTNNRTLTDMQVVRFYNQRGSMETNFTQLLNDWNWKRLPFSFMKENTVFMIIGAIGNLMYHHIIKKFSSKVDFVKESYRLKNFIFHFISVSLYWNSSIPQLYTEKDYSPICQT